MSRFLKGVAYLLVMLGTACTPRPGPVAAAGENGPLLSSMQVYTSGDAVTFVLQVTNTTEMTVPLTFPSGQSYDIVVRQGEREVWRWSDGQMFTQAIRSESVGAGETLRFEATWLPPAESPGEYTATGTLLATEHRVEQDTKFTLP